MSERQTTNAIKCNNYYKTKQCHKFAAMGYCPNSQACNFAHGVEEIRGPMQTQLAHGNESRKEMELCRNFHNRGSCGYGDKCKFVHEGNGSFDEAKRRGSEDPVDEKRKPCHHWRARGFCGYGHSCKFAHVTDDQYRVKASSEFNSAKDAITASEAHQTAEGTSPIGIREAYRYSQKFGALKRPILRKYMKKINGTYGDWIDDIPD